MTFSFQRSRNLYPYDFYLNNPSKKERLYYYVEETVWHIHFDKNESFPHFS